MDTKASGKNLYPRISKNTSDLIDLSVDVSDTSDNNILNLFDPLSHKTTDGIKFAGDQRTVEVGRQINRSSQSSSDTFTARRRGDRRFRLSNISTTKPSTSTDQNTAQVLGGRRDESSITTSSSTSSSGCGSGRINEDKLSSNSGVFAHFSSSSSSSLTDNNLDNATLNSTIENLSIESDSVFRQTKTNSSGNNNTSNLADAFITTPFIDQINKNYKLRLARKHQRSNQELIDLAEKLKSFRCKFKHHHKATNCGLIYSPTLYSSKVRDMSVKIIITSPLTSAPINFTCNVTTTVEHLISHAVCSMFDNLNSGDSMENYMLKVTGREEYFDFKLSLADYALVSHCWKFDLDVELTLIRADEAKRPFLRTSQDDFQCKSLLSPDDLISRSALLRHSDLNFEALSIVIETFEREADRLYHDVTNRSTYLQTQGLLQTTKAICSLMMNCETVQLAESKENVAELCRSYRDEGHELMDEDRYKMIEVIQHAIKRLTHNTHRMLKLTSQYLPVDYEVLDNPDVVVMNQSVNPSFVQTPINLVKDQISLRVHLISQIKPEWLAKYQEFHLEISVMHGFSDICSNISTSNITSDTTKFYNSLVFDQELTLSATYSSLPRESRFVLTLFGTEIQLPTTASINTNSNQLSVPNNHPINDDKRTMKRSESSTSISSTAPVYSSSPKELLSSAKFSSQYHLPSSHSTNINKNPRLISESESQTALATAISYLFDHKGKLIQGDKLVYMHPLTDGYKQDIYIETICDRNDPIIILEFKRFPPEKKIYFPSNIPHDSEGPSRVPKTNMNELKVLGYDLLDSGEKYVLDLIIQERQCCFEPLSSDDKSIWNKRLHLTTIPAALPKVLLSAPNWSYTHLDHIYQLVDCWAPLDAVDAIQLLLPSFPDTYIRKKAIEWISKQKDDELCDYIPQLLQAFRYEKCIDCPLFWMLIERSLKNVRIANLLYWQLKLNALDKLFQERSEILTNCLLWTNGSAFWKSMNKQEDLLSRLTSVSNEIKKIRDNQRLNVLHKKLEQVQDYLTNEKPTMPWAPSLEVCDLELKSCSYFPSNTLPIKLAFRSCEKSCNGSIKFHTYDTIFKIGDDLRQDMLAIQMIRIMEKLWLREGLDLRMVTYDCLATNDRQGMMEMVKNAETLRKIQQNDSFIASPFNSRAIDNYIRLWNTSELEYKTALDKFLHSCAGYSVATYILGICDRHNDNIMVTNSGHLFHIDFGKFLGDAQMMGSIKRDRTPFVLTADMAYVINGGDRPSKKFQTFIELCTMGFNIIRRHRNLFINLFALMSSAKINGLNSESVKYIDKMLMPSLTETEAMAKFTRLIDECLSSRSTQVNFFIHNLAQLRFTNDNSKQSILSFVPKTFTLQTDGLIESLKIIHMYKKYEPEKQYYYVVRVTRRDQPDATQVNRTFREFSELQMKLVSMYPYSHFHDLNKPTSSSSFLMDFVGRNNTREVAERRLIELKLFLKKLVDLPFEIAQCNLIYTFFHPILRDQTTNSIENSILSESTSSTFGSVEYNEAQRNSLYLGSNGQVKLSLSYKNASLIIMVMHAKNLACPEGTIGPNCYAKTYLLPDPHKQSKRKTRVVRQSCHPSFMELIVYNIPLDGLKKLTLQVSLWHSEIVQYKAFMGAALIPMETVDLTKETIGWFPLKNF